MRIGNWKAVALASRGWELYYLNNNRTERNNVAEWDPERTRELAAVWRDWAKRCGVWEWDPLQQRRRKQSRNPQ